MVISGAVFLATIANTRTHWLEARGKKVAAFF